MKKDKLTPRNQQRKARKSISPCNAASKSKLKNCYLSHKYSNKQNEQINSKDENSMKICLDLANYHKKQAQMLKKKNDILELRFDEQVQDMQHLKNELSKIKSTLSNSQNLKKELQSLKSQKNNLKKQNQSLLTQIKQLQTKIQELCQQNQQLKSKTKEIQSVLIESDCKYDTLQIKPLTFQKQSRRQQLVHKYQGITFVPSTVCLQCKRKQNQLEDAKNKYSKQLMDLQAQVASLQKQQIAIQHIERQLSSKTQSIEHLGRQVDQLQRDTGLILKTISLLQNKISDLSAQNSLLKGNVNKREQFCGSFARSAV